MSTRSRSSSNSSQHSKGIFTCEDDGSSGEKQSPINITKEIIDYDPTLKASQLKFSYVLGDAETVTITPTGFSCKIRENTTSNLRAHTSRNPSEACCSPGALRNTVVLTGSHLPAAYRFLEFHGHWGDTEEDGSEHKLNGKAFSGELHFVFWNPKYKKYEQCFNQSDGVAILAVFVSTSTKDNEYFNPLLMAVEDALATDAPIEIPKDFDFSKLLPDKLFYYTYNGSLTFTPFTECTIWTVLHRPIPMGSSQLAVLRTIVGDNAREMQQVNGRRVRASFKTVFKKKCDSPNTK